MNRIMIASIIGVTIMRRWALSACSDTLQERCKTELTIKKSRLTAGLTASCIRKFRTRNTHKD